MSKIKTQVTPGNTVETLLTSSLVGRAAIVKSHTRVSLPWRRSWGFVTLSCPTGTSEGPIRTSACEATREWHAPDTRDGEGKTFPRRACLALLAGFVLAFARLKNVTKPCLNSPITETISASGQLQFSDLFPASQGQGSPLRQETMGDRLLSEDKFSDRLTRRMPRRKSKFRFVSSLNFIPSLNKQREYL